MDPSSIPGFTDASKSQRTLMHGLARMSLAQISDACFSAEDPASVRMDESTASRLRSGQSKLTLGQFCSLLSAAKLKVVPEDAKCVRAPIYRAVLAIVTEAMQDAPTVERLFAEVGE